MMKQNFLSDFSCRLNSRLDGVELSAPVIDLMSGISAGFLTGLLTNPMDVVTARLMTQKVPYARTHDTYHDMS